MMKMKVGFGFDVHPLKKGADLWLGGIKIPSEKGSLGHSDADVLIHAICDALLGALGLRDIGFHFPDSNPDYKGISSSLLLEEVCRMVQRENYRIANIDATVSLERPKIAEFIPDIKKSLTRITGISEEDISIKATTTEKLGFTGREEGIAAYCVALVNRL